MLKGTHQQLVQLILVWLLTNCHPSSLVKVSLTEKIKMPGSSKSSTIKILFREKDKVTSKRLRVKK